MMKVLSNHLILLSLLGIFLIALSQPLNAQTDLLIRQPAVSPDGQQIAFSWQGDIWTVSAAGGDAKRLTIHESYESSPVWSNDGNTIAFVSERYGNRDIFTMTKDGANIQRKTYHSATDYNPSFDDAGNLYFSTRRLFASVERDYEVYRLDKNAQTPYRFLDATALDAAISPNGKLVTWVRGTCRKEREAYTGPANRNVWMYNVDTKKYTPIANNNEQETMPRWAGNQQLFYLSAKNGKYNIYGVSIDGDGKAGEPKAITNDKKMGIRYFSLSSDGQTIAFTRGADLMVMKDGGKPQPIKIKVTSDYRFDPIEHKMFKSGVTSYSITPNGKLTAFITHGEVFVGAADKEQSRAVNISDHPFREREVIWQNDSVLLFTSDRNGNYDIYQARSADADEPSLFKSFKRDIQRVTNTQQDERSLALSPDGKQLAFIRGTNLMVVDINDDGSLGKERTLTEGWNAPSGVVWSPDSKHLAYSRSDLNFNEEVFIHPVDGSTAPVNVSMHPRDDYNPVWSKDGSKLGFISIRNNGDADVWFAWLKKSDWEKTSLDWKDEANKEGGKKGKKSSKKKGKKGKDEQQVAPIQIDFEDIHDRLVQVTYLPGNESSLAIDAKGEFFYFMTNRGSNSGSEGDSDYKKVKWNGEEMKTVLPKTRLYGIELSADGKSFYFIKSGKVNKLGTKAKKPDTYTYNAKMDINHPKEMQQIFDEAWRVINDGFYDPNFHGKDWEKLSKTYKPIALSASTIQDFRVIFNEMLGQLNASHMGLRGFNNPEDVQRERTGLIGAEITPVNNGVKITYVLPNSPASKSASQLNVGDVITAINGATISGNNYYALLEGTANERTLFNVTAADGTTREVIIRPTNSLYYNLYEAWVKEREALVAEYSNNQLGYIHIQGMNWRSFERFERELTAAGAGKKGIVIDVRYNGGGWTTDMLMAVLNVRQHAYTVPRGAVKSLEKENKNFSNYYPYGERLPLAAWTGPAIALCNQNSYSNAEIFSHAFKTLGRGTLVGQPTFGAVISTGAGGLIDGSYVRRPFRAWYVKATGENMEFVPATPNILIENAPNYRASGNDAQLKKATEQLLEEIN